MLEFKLDKKRIVSPGEFIKISTGIKSEKDLFLLVFLTKDYNYKLSTSNIFIEKDRTISIFIYNPGIDPVKIEAGKVAFAKECRA